MEILLRMIPLVWVISSLIIYMASFIRFAKYVQENSGGTLPINKVCNLLGRVVPLSVIVYCIFGPFSIILYKISWMETLIEFD